MPAKKKRARKKASKAKKPDEKSFDDKMEDFGNEMERLGKKFGKEMEKAGKEFGKRMDEEDWEQHFKAKMVCECKPAGAGLAGPLAGAVIGLVFLVILIEVLNFIVFKTGIFFFAGLSAFLHGNIGFLFIAGVFFGYAGHLERRWPRAFKPFSPAVKAAGLAFAVWILANIVQIINEPIQNMELALITRFAMENLLLGFVLFAAIGYIVLLAGLAWGKKTEGSEKMVTEKPAARQPKSKRLYRSGRDKILGGVCGGIAEYFSIDPVIVRLLWIAFSLAGGSGILCYIIAWIIIPRNPDHKWD